MRVPQKRVSHRPHDETSSPHRIRWTQLCPETITAPTSELSFPCDLLCRTRQNGGMTSRDAHVTPPEGLAPVPRGWGKAATSDRRSIWISIGFGAAAVLLAVSVLTDEFRGRDLIPPVVLAALAFIAWALSLTRSRSRKAPRLSNALDFTDASKRPRDSWVHFCALRAVQWPLILVFALIGASAGTAAVVFAVVPPVSTSRDEGLGNQPLVWLAAILCAVVALLFLYAAKYSFQLQRINGGWPRRYGVALGAHGITLHLPGVDREIAWSNVESVRAELLWQKRKSSRDSAAITIAWQDEARAAHVQHAFITAESLDVSPHMLFTALQLYWSYPELRRELGTTRAQRRMSDWAAGH